MIFRHLKPIVFFCLMLSRAMAQDSLAVRDSVLIKANIAEATAHLNSANQLLKKNKPQDAFAQLNIAKSLYQKAADGEGQANVMLAFGDYYASNYVWKKAEVSYLNALKIAPADGYELRGNVSQKLAGSYLRQQNVESAAKYYSMAINQFDKADLMARSASNYVSLAGVRTLQKRYSDAEYMIMKRALPLFRSAGYVPGRIGCFDVLGRLYFEQKRFSEAKWYYIQANMLGRTLRDSVAVTESLINLGNVKTSIGDYKLALKDFKEAQYLSKKYKLLKQQRDVNNAFSRLYAKTGDKSASNSSLQKYDELNDSMSAIEQKRITAASKTKPTALAVKQKKLPVIANIKQNPWLLITALAIVSVLVIFRFFVGGKRKP